MDPRKYILGLAMLTILSATCGAQDRGGQTPVSPPDSTSSASGDKTQPEALDTLPTQDQDTAESSSERHSFFLANLDVNQIAAGSPAGPGSPSQVSFFTDAVGSLHWLSLQRRSETAVDYLAGADVYQGSSSYQIQQLDVSQRIRWPGRELTFADEFGDLPGGSFGSQWFGGASAYDLGVAESNANSPSSGNLGDFFGSNDFGGVGLAAYITNVSLAEYSETVTPRSSFSLVGGYEIAAYSLSSVSGPGLINSHGAGGQASYTYQLNHRNQVGLVYGLRNLRFPYRNEGSLETNLLELTYGRQISRRASLAIGVGPELARVSNPVTGLSHPLNLSGSLSISYHLRKASLASGYDRLVTSGSGLFAGARTDTVNFFLTRPTRKWDVSFDLGYARLRQLGGVLGLFPAQSYQYGFAGAGLRRQYGPHVGLFISYQFSDESFGNPTCVAFSPCSAAGQSHTLTVGINLGTRPKPLE